MDHRRLAKNKNLIVTRIITLTSRATWLSKDWLKDCKARSWDIQSSTTSTTWKESKDRLKKFQGSINCQLDHGCFVSAATCPCECGMKGSRQKNYFIYIY